MAAAPCAWLLLLFPLWSQAEEPASYESTKKLPPLHHAVDIPYPDDWRQPDELPLSTERKLECRTCHGLKNMERRLYEGIDTKAKDFLRGGPYPRLERFCYRCHDPEEFERPNIHIMLDDKGELREDHCTYCHEELHKERDRPLERSEYKLRLPPEKLCYGCHLKTPHFNALEHQASKPKEKMRKHLREAAERQGILLPLSESGTVMCATCHTPHQYGVIDPGRNPAGKQVDNHDLEEGVRYRDHPWNRVVREDKQRRLAVLNRETGEQFNLDYRRIDREVLLRLPARDGSLCLSCHEFER